MPTPKNPVNTETQPPGADMSITSDVRDVIVGLTSKLPFQFAALLLVNMVFVAGLLYFVNMTARTRAEIDTARMKHIESILVACVNK